MMNADVGHKNGPGRMSQRTIILVAAILLSVPPGKAFAEIPVITARNGSGVSYNAQTFEGSRVSLDPRTLSIAEVYREAANWGGSIPAISTSVLCEISDEGNIEPATCEADSWSSHEQSLAMKLIRTSPRSAFPQFPSIDRAALGLTPRVTTRFWSSLVSNRASAVKTGTPFYRLVRMAVRIDPADAPALDLAAGPLIDASQLTFEHGKGPRMMQYPPRAARENRGGVQIAECQVQLDRSVLCRDEAFDPPENAPYFAGSVDGMFKQAVVEERLKSGASAPGSRFRFQLRWTLPD